MKPPVKAPEMTLIEAIKLYKPLLVIALVAFATALSLMAGTAIGLMAGWMGIFLVLLATLKLFDLNGFAAAFTSYDPLAARSRLYALIYPFVEITLGLLFLTGMFPVLTNLGVLIVFGINAIGVLAVVRQGRNVRCGCAGAGFVLPVGRVTLFEDLFMVGMAGFNLLNLAF